MTDSLFLGFDGGATKTAGTAIDRQKEVVAEAVGNAGNFQVIGVNKASENILDVTEAILKKADAKFSQIKSMYLGLAGAGRPDDADRMHNGFVELLNKRNHSTPKVQIGSDAIAALEGAFAGKPGMILISGTGSILFAKDEVGRIHRTGGWGRFIGDEGSGYALGRACLSAVARDFDGRGKKTLMTRLLKEEKKIDDPQSLIAKIYQENFDIASAAPIVIEAAEKGDEVAIGVIADNANQLVDHVCAMIDKLGKMLPLVLSGSILSIENILSRRLQETIKRDFPGIKIQIPQFSPSVGAALLALKAGGID